MLLKTIRRSTKTWTGSGFHIGNGVIATASHVLDQGSFEEAVHEHANQQKNVSRIYVHGKEDVDVAVAVIDLDPSYDLTLVMFREDERRNREKTDRIPLGEHLDDWVGSEFILSCVLIMGHRIDGDGPFGDVVSIRSEGPHRRLCDDPRRARYGSRSHLALFTFDD